MIPTSVLTHLTRVPGVRNLWRKYQWGRFETRVRFGICRRPHYAYGVHRAALLAKSLGLKSISVFEFGVAGGNGLLALESLAQEVSRLVGIHIATYGFDTGTGMPPPKGYRDLPYIWEEGFYKMEPEKLRERLTTAKLVLGDVRETIPALMNVVGFEPVGFIAFDLDYYSSTKDAFQVFVENPETRLPRVYSYFDDIYWPEAACHNPYIGELAAIREFNEEYEFLKLCPINMLEWMLPYQSAWQEQIYVMHDFHHPLYSVNITPKDASHTQLPL
jgi:hypothetical protein